MNRLNHVFNKYKILIPVIVLTGMYIWTLKEAFLGTTMNDGINTTTTRVVLNFKHYGAFALIILNYIFFFLFRSYEKYILISTIILGVLCLINFTPSEYIGGLGFHGLKVEYQRPSLLVGILVYILFFKKTNQFISHIFNPPIKQIKETDIRKVREQIERIKERYSKYSDAELNQMLNENKLMEEALIAARELLTERQILQ